MPETEFQLTNDDEPQKLAPRRLRVTRHGLTVAGQPAVLASVDPPLTGDGWGAGTSEVLLVSRTRDVSIEEMIDDEGRRPGRVHVCRYQGESAQIPSDVPRSDVSVEFWGRLT